MPLEAAAAAADSLALADVLAAGGPLRFLHPIMRSAVHEQIPAQRRGMAHLAAAELLLGDGAGAERAAWHLLHAPRSRRAWVVETLRAAAGAAAARGSPETAVALLRRALAEAPGSEDVLLEVAEAEFLVQDPAAVQRARDALSAAGTPARRAQAGLLAARALTPLGRYDEAVKILDGLAGEAARLGCAVPAGGPGRVASRSARETCSPSWMPPKKRNLGLAAVFSYTRVTDLILGWSGATPARTSPNGVGSASSTSTSKPAARSWSAA